MDTEYKLLKFDDGIVIIKNKRRVVQMTHEEWSYVIAHPFIEKAEETDVEPRTDAEGVADGDTGGNDTVA